MKKFLLLISFLGLLVVVSGCKKDTTTVIGDPDKDYLAYNLATDSETWDPGFNSASDGGHIIANTYEGLYRDTPNGRVLAGITEEPTITEEGTVYTFKLSQEAKWSNGEPVTAHDYVFGWTRVLNPDNPSDYSFIVSPYLLNGECYIADTCEDGEELGVKAIDDYTLEVTLEMPLPYFKDLLAFYTYMPIYSNKGQITTLADGWEKDASTAISNGPFKFVEYKIGSHVLLEKNDYYYNKDEIALDGLKFLIIKDATTALNAFDKGDINVLDSVPMDRISDLLTSNADDFEITANIGTYFFVFNMDDSRIGTPAGASGKLVRQALSMVIDRQSIVENITKGGEIPAGAFVPPTILDVNNDPWYDPTEESPYGINYTVDSTIIAAAKAKLVDAGYETEEQLKALGDSITIGYNQTASDGHKDICAYIQETWKTELGILVGTQQQEWAVFQTSKRLGAYEFARAGWLGDYPDPNTMLDLFTSYSGNNDAQWRFENSEIFDTDKVENPGQEAFDIAIENAMNETDAAKRELLLREAEHILLVDEHILTPIYHYTRKNLIDSGRVTGVERTLMGQWYFGNASLVG